jgi:hypothetical protein
MVVLILLITAGSIVTFLQQKHAFDYKTLCEENLKAIGIALRAYQEAYGTLPPAYFAGPSEQPSHSWRVMLLGFLKEKDADALAAVYRWAEPWDSEHNGRLLDDFMPAAYHCPSQQRARWAFKHTHFVAPVGAGTAWPGQAPGQLPASGKQIILIEYRGEDIPWTSPRDLAVDAWDDTSIADSKTGIGSPHGADPLVLYADGSVERLSSRTLLSDLKARCQPAAGSSP